MIEAVGAGCSVLVGHSLGSVVAFETVALHPELSVGALVTAGSPLSMRTVASRLRAGGPESSGPLPGRVQRWVNIYDPADPVAAAGPVSRLWPDASDFTVDNGNEPHSITRYLAKRITGETSPPARSRRSTSTKSVPTMTTGASISTKQRPSHPAKNREGRCALERDQVVVAHQQKATPRQPP